MRRMNQRVGIMNQRVGIILSRVAVDGGIGSWGVGSMGGEYVCIMGVSVLCSELVVYTQSK